MTRHTWRTVAAIDPGATYYPMDGARQCDPLEPDDVIAALDAWEGRREELVAAEESGECWIGPFEWRGGKECPLPLDTIVSIGGTCPIWRADNIWWENLTGTFRYRTPDPAGWLPRRKFIPPAELWAPECPVRCEWTCGLPSEGAVSHLSDDYWDRPPRVQYIRLVARQPQAGLPEGWRIDDQGGLCSEYGSVLGKADYASYSPAAIRQGVDAWLREMGDE